MRPVVVVRAAEVEPNAVGVTNDEVEIALELGGNGAL